MHKPVKLLIVEDHILMREGLVSLFRPQPDFTIVGEAGTVSEAIEKTRELEPDMVLMDFGLPDGSGVEATRAILAHRPETLIVFLTVHEADDNLFAAVRIGAKGYLLKNLPVAKLLESLRAVVRGEPAISRAMMGRIMQEFTHTPTAETGLRGGLRQLTLREVNILQELAAGKTNQDIAKCLFISDNTVKHHVHNILRKLNVKNRREAVEYAQNHGLGSSRRPSAPDPGL